MPVYQPSHSYEHFNVPRNYRIMCDVSSYEEPTFVTMDHPVKWPTRFVPITFMHH